MDYELWFVEFEMKFDKLMARSERRWAALEQRGVAVEPCIGGLEQTGATLLVEADNWGGLFEPAPVPEERVLDPTSTVIASSDSDALPFVPVLDAAFIPAPQFHEVAPGIDKMQVAPREAESPGFLVARTEQGWQVAVVRGEGLGASGRVFVGVNLEPRGSLLCHFFHAEQLLGSNADQVLTERFLISALDRNSIAQRSRGIREILVGDRSSPRPPRLRHPRRAPPRPPWLRQPRRAPLLPSRLRRARRAPPRPPWFRRPRSMQLHGPWRARLCRHERWLRRASPHPPASPTCFFLGESDPHATKEHFAKAYERDLTSHPPRPDVFAKDADSCMYTPTNCSTQVLNGNNHRTNHILHHTIGVSILDAAGFMVVALQSVVGSTWASSYCLSQYAGVWYASQDASKLIISGSSASIAVATALSPAAVGAQLVFNGMPSRYTIILSLAYSVDDVPTCSASESYIVQNVSVRQLVDSQVHLASVRGRAQLRPLPWPSFSSSAASVQWNSGMEICLAFCDHSTLPSMVVRNVHILQLWVFDETWSYHLVQECWHERFLKEAKHIEAICNDFRLLDIHMLISSLVASGGTKIGAIVLFSDGHHVQIHTFSFDLDHDSAAILAISDISSGTFSFIHAEGSMQDGFAQCIDGLPSVVDEEMQLGIECHGVLLTSIKSDGSTSQVAGNVRGGSVNIGDMYADEERRFLVTLCFGLLAVQYRPPWSSPNQLVILSDDVHYEFNLQCWKDFIELQPWPTPAILHTNISNELVETISVGCKLNALDNVTLAASNLPELSYDDFHRLDRHVKEKDMASGFMDSLSHTSTYKMATTNVNPVDWQLQVWRQCGLLFNIMVLQVPWDPGGSDLLHRLGGKPKIKRGGMSGQPMVGPSYGPWAWALSSSGLPEQLGIVYKRARTAARGRESINLYCKACV